MSLQTQFSAPLTDGSENWLPEKKPDASAGGRPVTGSFLKAAISIILLVGVVALVVIFYGISEIIDDIRALSIVTLAPFSLP